MSYFDIGNERFEKERDFNEATGKHPKPARRRYTRSKKTTRNAKSKGWSIWMWIAIGILIMLYLSK